jgi:integrase
MSSISVAAAALQVSERDCEEWLAKFQKHYAPTVANNSIAIVREVFQRAIRAGARFNNPTDSLSPVRIHAKRLELPSREQFLRFVEEIRTGGARQSKDCANLVKFPAYSGVRIGEAKFVTWADANFDRRQLHVRGDPITATKNGEMKFVPMIPELEQMLKQLRAERPNEPATAQSCESSSAIRSRAGAIFREAARLRVMMCCAPRS